PCPPLAASAPHHNPMSGALARLDRIRRAVAAGRPLPPEDGLALANAIASAKREGISIDEALELPSGWQRAARLRKRDAALRALAAEFAGKGRAQARKMHEALRRYAAAGYLVDRKRPDTPTGSRGHFFILLEATSGDGLSEE